MTKKQEIDTLYEAMVHAKATLNDMATALHTLGCQGLKTADIADNLAAVLGAYADAPPQYICSKHGIIESDEIIYGEIGRTPTHWSKYCRRCWDEDKQWTRVYKWSDQLTREDFEISPPNPKN